MALNIGNFTAGFHGNHNNKPHHHLRIHISPNSSSFIEPLKRPSDFFVITLDLRVRVVVPSTKKRRRRIAGVNMLKVEELTPELREIVNANMDDVKERRRARDAFKDIQLNIDHLLFKTKYDGLKTREVEMISFCHGYGDTCTFFFEGIARKFVSYGYGVLAMDLPGFGLSEGLHGYIPSFDGLVDDVIEYYSKIIENLNLRDLPRFLLGQSMGGAVALKVHLKQPDFWTGAVLVAPMCKIVDDIVPPWAVMKFLMGIAKFLPKYKLVPQKDLGDMAFRDPKKKPLTSYNVKAYKDRPRLGTAMELLNTTQDIGDQLEKISLPLLILHGKDNIVTDPFVSKTLYEKARSLDKKLNLYDHGCHALLEGETDDVILRVFRDIITWLDEHC